MKKLLLAGVAAGTLVLGAPAFAGDKAPIDIEVGGYFKGYGAFTDADTGLAGTAANEKDFDFVRDTELHVGGETTLDNGLTVGVQFEFDIDQADGTAGVDESYLYFSGNWGRVNFGGEDGAAYLLQVAAPSADSNVDGLRQYVSSYGTRLDYDHAVTGKNDKLTFLSPIYSGLQFGASYTPDGDAAADRGVGTESGTEQTYEAAVRYEGEFSGVGVIAGAGYSYGEERALGADQTQATNVGLDLDLGPFGIGASYTTSEDSASNDSDIIVVGADYTSGPFKLGASYYNTEVDNATDYERYTGGVTYKYGAGMSFRGSLQYLEDDNGNDGTSALIGTQVKF